MKRLGLCLGLAFAAAACSTPISSGGDGGSPTAISLESSEITADRTTGIAADGKDSVAITVTIKDASGAPVSGKTVTLIATGTGNKLSALAADTDASGKAPFALTSTKAEPKTLSASVAEGRLTRSLTVTFVPGAGTKLVFLADPVASASGTPLALVQVVVEDVSGNLATNYAQSLTMSLKGGTAGASLGGTLSVKPEHGVANFADLTIDRTGTGYTLGAAGLGLESATSAPFDISSGPAASLSFAKGPVNGKAGVALAKVVVNVRDASANLVKTSSASVTLTLAGGPAGSALKGTATVAAVGGVATFADLALEKSGTGYTLVASSAALVGVTSAAFDIAPGAPGAVAFVAAPSDTKAGVAIAPAVTVSLQDAFGNQIDSGASVTLAIGAGPAGATLTGTSTQSALAGLATFTDLKLDKAGPYTLTAAAGGFTAVTSATFNVAAGAPSRLRFVTQPASVKAGVVLPSVDLALEDAFGNRVVSATTPVALTLLPAGSVLKGTASKPAVAGVASFPDLTVEKVGSYTLGAAATGYGTVTSSAFTITPAAASKIRFTVQPGNAQAGVALSPAVEVVLEDAFGNRAASTATVDLAIASGPLGATLGGTRSLAAVNGRAAFSTLTLDKAGAYTLSATATGAGTATSPPFDITPGAPGKVAFTVEPSAVQAGVLIAPAMKVELQDNFGNRIPVSDGITLAIASGPTGATLTGPRTQPANAGVATFAALKLDKVGSYTLTASATGYSAATSASFVVSAGAPDKVVFSVQPAAALAGKVIAPPVEVTLLDAFGNVIPGTDTVTLSLATSPSGATLAGTAARPAVAGKASFDDLKLTRAGSYTFTAAATGFTSATSSAFAISPAATDRLAIKVQPANARAGETITPAIEVSAQDAFGNLVTTATNVTMAIATGPSGGALAGTRTRSTGATGVASFDNFSFDVAGSYTVTASAGGTITAATTQPFTIVGAAPARLVFIADASDTVAGQPIGPLKLGFVDGFGNPVPGTGDVTVALASGAGTLLGTKTQTPVAGVATFGDLKLNKVGTYTISASSAGVASATSASFAITPGASASLVLVTQPATVEVRTLFNLDVDVLDAFGNKAAQATDSVTLTLGGGAGTLGGTATVSAVAGRASFGGLSVTDEATTYKLTASSGTLTPAASSAFTVTDTTPPAAASNFAAATPGSNTVTVSWTAPGDDGLLGNAATNEVRYSTAAITSANFSGATIGATATAKAPGSSETAALSGLSSNTAYFLALKVTDAAGNSSYAFATTTTKDCATGYTGGACTSCATGFRQTSPGVCQDFCTNPDPCNPPPSNSCGGTGNNTAIVYPTTRSCTPGTTSPFFTCQAATQTDCSATGKLCFKAACVTDPCVGFTCTPAAASCSGNTVVTPVSHCAAVDGGSGSLVAQCVSDAPQNTDCAATSRVCFKAACIADPCAGVSCPPKPATCGADRITLTTPTASCTRVDQSGTLTAVCADGSSTTTDCSATAQVCFTGACQAASAPGAGDLLVTEVLHTPAAKPVDGQWFEVKNLSTKLLNLAGLKIDNVTTGHTFSVPASAPVLLKAGGLFVFGYSADTTANGGAAVDFAWGSITPQFPLGATGHLKLSLGAVTVEDVDYGVIAPAVAAGVAVNVSAKAQGKGGNQSRWYWCAATAALSGGDLGTPGAANGDCGVTLAPPVDYCVVQFPKDAGIIDSPSKVTVYSQFYEPSVTDRNTSGNDSYPFVIAELGYGRKPATGAPDPTAWTWVPAKFNAGYTTSGNNDEMQADLALTAAGDYLYGYRYSLKDPATGTVGAPVYCDRTNVVADPTTGSYGTITFFNASADIAAARAKPDGTGLSVAITGAFVTYVKPTIGTDLAGFFVQGEKLGPALFIQVDPASLTPVPVAGDRVSFTITTMATANTQRQATAVTTFSRLSQGNALAGLVQDLSAATDLVTALGNYETELETVTGTITSAFASGGAGFVSGSFDTAGVVANANLKLRLPTAVQTSLELVSGCVVKVKQAPLWRFNLQAQVSAWTNADLQVLSCPAPKVTSASGSGANGVLVNFDRSIDPASILANGSQFTTAPALTIVSAAATAGNAKQITLTTGAQATGTYTLTVAGTIKDIYGGGVAAPNNTATFSGFGPCAPSVVISQVYGAGGNAGATYTNDFIELHNRGTTPVSLVGMSVQYASTTGSAWVVTTLTGSIAPGGYFLIQEAAGGTASAALPTPDLVGTIAMAGSAGKVALVNGTTAIASGTVCPVGTATILDFVGYGTGTNCSEGGSGTVTQTLTSTTSAQRASSACQDSNNNTNDFTAALPAPRNSSTTANQCGCL